MAAADRQALRVLTDDPLSAGTFVPEAALEGWQQSVLPPTHAALVEALGIPGVWSQDLPLIHPFWRTLVVRSHTESSQFDALTHLLGARGWQDEPVVAAAVTGRRFHGLRGRRWAAARGNLHVSVALPTALDAAHAGVGLSMLPCVAVLDAIADVTDGAVRPAVKWVNDIVIGGRKVGGVLTSAVTAGQRIEGVVWGIGINVAVAPEIVATPFVPAATCLHAEPGGAHVTIARLFRSLLDAIARRYVDLAHGGAAALFPSYRERSLVIGREVQVWDESACIEPDASPSGPPAVEGIVADICHDLSLRLEGQLEPVTKGRLALRSM
ncbi:MAG TPA: biotin--[acetyl-CoA-carboxylase] ligase [Vicinamibacterales bacterium]